jgi:hypothetical protein
LIFTKCKYCFLDLTSINSTRFLVYAFAATYAKLGRIFCLLTGAKATFCCGNLPLYICFVCQVHFFGFLEFEISKMSDGAQFNMSHWAVNTFMLIREGILLIRLCT